MFHQKVFAKIIFNFKHNFTFNSKDILCFQKQQNILVHFKLSVHKNHLVWDIYSIWCKELIKTTLTIYLCTLDALYSPVIKYLVTPERKKDYFFILLNPLRHIDAVYCTCRQCHNYKSANCCRTGRSMFFCSTNSKTRVISQIARVLMLKKVILQDGTGDD